MVSHHKVVERFFLRDIYSTLEGENKWETFFLIGFHNEKEEWKGSSCIVLRLKLCQVLFSGIFSTVTISHELTLILTVAFSLYVLEHFLVKVQSPKPLVSLSQTQARAKCQPAAELINAFQERRQRRRGCISCHPNENKQDELHLY